MQHSLATSIRVLVYATFFVPLVVVPSSFVYPLLVPKILLFRSLVLLLVGCYSLLLYMNWRAYMPRFTSVAIALLAFLASFAFSTFFGVDAYRSFWDSHERMLGLFTITHYLIYFVVCTALFRTWDDWKWALRVFLIAGSIVMCVGILQKTHPDLIQQINPDLLLNQTSDRMESTLGNPIYVGGYGLFLLFAAFLLVMREKHIAWIVVESTMGSLGVVGILLSGTRGSLVGLSVGVVVVVAGYAVALKRHAGLRRTLFAILAILVLVGGVLFEYREMRWVNSIPAVGRLLNPSLTDTEPRSIAWGIALESWKDHPVFGWGPNNFFYAFTNQHFNPRSLELGEPWYDNAHNVLLNTLAVQGLVGLTTYLALFVVAIGSLMRAYRRGDISVHLLVIAAGFLVAHLAQNITVFENPTSYLYFMFWLAMINSLIQTPDAAEGQKEAQAASDRDVGIGTVTVVGVVIGACIFVLNVQPARANMKTLAAMIQFAGNPQVGLSAVRDALSFDSPHIDDIRSDLTRYLTDVVGSAYQRLGKELSNEILVLGVESQQKNIALHPRDIRLYLSLAQLSQVRSMVNNDGTYLADAARYLEAVLVYSPRRLPVVYMLSDMKAQLGQKDDAIRLLEKTLHDDPKAVESYWRLAYIYSISNDHKKAQEILALANERGILFTGQGQQIVGTVIARAKDAGMLLPPR